MDTTQFLQHLNRHIGLLIPMIDPEKKCKCEVCHGQKFLLSALLDMQRAILSENKTAHLFAIDTLIDAHDNMTNVTLSKLNEDQRKEHESQLFETRSHYLQARSEWMEEFGPDCVH